MSHFSANVANTGVRLFFHFGGCLFAKQLLNAIPATLGGAN